MIPLLFGLAEAQDLDAVVLAAEHVPPGVVLERDQIYTARLATEHVPPHTFADVRAVVGRLVLEPLLPHAPIREERLAPPQTPPGLEGVLPLGYDLVRLPLAQPSGWLRAGDWIDVVRVIGEEACYVASAIGIVAGELASGERLTSHLEARTLHALHVAVPHHAAGRVASLDPDQTTFVLRNPGDRAPLEAGLAWCDAPPGEIVTHDSTLDLRIARGGLRVQELARGENAYVGKLILSPGGRIRPRETSAEEYLYVLQGRGTLTIDQTTHYVTPGTAIYVPPRSRISFVNGARSLIALQVFAGPGPADRFASWRSASPPARSERSSSRAPRPASPAQEVPGDGEDDGDKGETAVFEWPAGDAPEAAPTVPDAAP